MTPASGAPNSYIQWSRGCCDEPVEENDDWLAEKADLDNDEAWLEEREDAA